jgi:hypothetical protein
VTQCASSFSGSASSSSSSSRSGSSSVAAMALQQTAAPWVALLARCLVALAGLMEAAGVPACQPGTAPAPNDQQLLQPPPVLTQHRVVPVLELVTSCMVALTSHLCRAGLPPDQLQQLQEQHAAAMVHVCELQRAHAGTGPVVSMQQQQLSSAMQQLCSFAQAVAGRIPLTVACNNPCCTNLAQRSELVLVRGKSCVCARCKAAR